MLISSPLLRRDQQEPNLAFHDFASQPSARCGRSALYRSRRSELGLDPGD